MKNKTVIILLSVLAVALYTVAVINFCLGDVLSGIADVLMALGVSREAALADACKIEHDLSEETFDCIKRYRESLQQK